MAQKELNIELKEKTSELNKFRLALDQAPGAVYIVDKNMNFEYINPAFTQLSGYTAEELLHKNLQETLYKGQIPESRRELVDALSKGNNWQGELLSYNKSGLTYWANTIASPYKDEDGNIEGYIVIQLDITERNSMERALRESESKYKTLVENSQDGITIIKDNQILFANNTYCKMLNYTIDELYSMPAVNTLHPSEHEKAFKIAERRRNKDFSTINEVFLMLTKDGQIKECETSSTLIEYNGQYASFFTSHDITESKRMQLKIKESEEKYRQLVESTNSIILKWDKNFRITFLNEYGLRFFGFTKDEIFSNPMVGTIIPYSEDYSGRNLSDLMDAIFKNPEQYAQNINENMRKNGERVWVSWNNTAIRDEQGEIINMFSVGTDITENRRIQLELKESEEKYRQLFSAESDAIFMIDAETGGIMDANPAASTIYGYSHQELINMKNTDVSAEPKKTIDATKHNQTLVPIRYHKKKNGTIFPVELSAGFTTFKNRKIQIVTSRDITARIKAENDLRLAKKELEMLNHDLEERIIESSKKITEVNTQLINLQKENLQSQFDVLKQQVNPHFLFNSLNVLTSLIKIEPDLAEKFTEQLSKVYRYVLENKDNELVSLNTELDFLKAYIFLLDIRFVDKLKFNINIPVNKLEQRIIPLAMQLLIENAIKHNTMSKSEPLCIDVFIDENNTLNIVNNLQERKTQILSTGVGLKNIKNRYSLLTYAVPEFEKTETLFIAKVPLI